MKKIILLIITTLTQLEALPQVKDIPKLTFDHLLIAVDNLDSAKQEYERYGFTVVYGGSKKVALNALIFLEDGSLIELIGKDRFPWYFNFFYKLRLTKFLGKMKDRIASFGTVKSGFFNYSLYSSDLLLTYEYLTDSSIATGRPKLFKRKRDDGIDISWSLLGTKPFDLPFIIGDYTPSRLSNNSLMIHKNGAKSINSITIETSKFDEYYGLYCKLFQQKPNTQGSYNKSAHFKTKDIIIELTSVRKLTKEFYSESYSSPLFFTINCQKTGSTFQTDKQNIFKLIYE